MDSGISLGGISKDDTWEGVLNESISECLAQGEWELYLVTSCDVGHNNFQNAGPAIPD